MQIVWTDYLKYRAKLRGFQLARLEEIVRYGTERYYDTSTGRFIAVGRHGQRLCIIPYEIQEDAIVPVTVHVTTRQQITQRIRKGRYVHVQG